MNFVIYVQVLIHRHNYITPLFILQVDAIPVAMVEKICYGKLLLQPQTISIGSFENTPTNDTIPKSLYGTVIVAVFCSSTSESRLLLNESSMVSTENLSNSLISLGLISLFLESPLVKDIVSDVVLTVNQSDVI